jgi:hypothetical protein
MKQSLNEIKRMQFLAGIITEGQYKHSLDEEASDPAAEKKAEQGLEKALNIFNTNINSVKPSPKDGEIEEGLVTLFAVTVGAPGLLGLLGKGADLIGQYFSQGTITSTKIGAALQKAGHVLEHKYIKAIASLLQKAYPKSYKNQDPFDEESELHDKAHGIYAAILAAAAVGSGMEAASAVNLIMKGLEGGAAAFKASEVIQLTQKIAAA